MVGLQYFKISLLILGLSAAPVERSFSACTVEGIPPMGNGQYHVNKNVFKEDYTGIVAEYPSTGITGVSVDKGTYLDISIKNDKIVIKTTEDFPNFEKYAGPIYGPIEFSTFFIFECGGNVTSRLNFIQKIIDINNHDPYFNKESFEFKYGMSLRQGFELNIYSTIAGMDDDLTSGQVKFEISGDVLKIAPRNSVARGHEALVTLKEDIAMPFDEEFEITITDQGEMPFRSTKAKLRLILATDDSKPTISPLFSKPLSIWQYDKKQKFISVSEPVILIQGFGTGLKIKQIDYQDYFATELDDPVTGNVTIELKKELSEDIVNENYIFLNLEAELPNAKQIAKTTVIIEIV